MNLDHGPFCHFNKDMLLKWFHSTVKLNPKLILQSLIQVHYPVLADDDDDDDDDDEASSAGKHRIELKHWHKIG